MNTLTRSALTTLTLCTALGFAIAPSVAETDTSPKASAKTRRAASEAPFVLECEEEPEKKGAKKTRVTLAKATTKHRAKRSAYDDSVRRSAQRGLDFLTDATLQWQKQHKCMGCHVQGVTAEALSVGKHHQYTVDDKQMKTVFTGLLDLSGGIRTDIGHASPGNYLRASTRAFGGASIARYDRWIGDEYGEDLLVAAADLLTHQDADGKIHQAYNHGIAKGPLQGTYQAIQTWQQAYARTADDRWLTAISKSEEFLQRTIEGWYATPTNDLQHVNYAMLGLLAADVGSTEKVAEDLQKRLLAAQNPDGGFPLNIGGPSKALATGQTLYTLRRMGMNDSDAQISKAAAYLIEMQQADGGWSDSGAEKAEAMWAVLGLVSTDVISVEVAGLEQGQHIEGTFGIIASAKDNEGGEVKKIQISVDDIPVGGACKPNAVYALDSTTLERGVHTIDVEATNLDGKTSRRRFTVYAGDHYMTNLGSKYVDGGTMLSLRDIAPSGMKHTVELRIKDAKGETVRTVSQKGAQGPVSFHWKGELDTKKK